MFAGTLGHDWPNLAVKNLNDMVFHINPEQMRPYATMTALYSSVLQLARPWARFSGELQVITHTVKMP